MADIVPGLLHQLGLVLKETTASTRYLLDSFTVAACDNMRISRCHLIADGELHGYIASKRRYFYGVMVQAVTADEGVARRVGLPVGRGQGRAGDGRVAA